MYIYGILKCVKLLSCIICRQHKRFNKTLYRSTRLSCSLHRILHHRFYDGMVIVRVCSQPWQCLGMEGACEEGMPTCYQLSLTHTRSFLSPCTRVWSCTLSLCIAVLTQLRELEASLCSRQYPWGWEKASGKKARVWANASFGLYCCWIVITRTVISSTKGVIGVSGRVKSLLVTRHIRHCENDGKILRPRKFTPCRKWIYCKCWRGHSCYWGWISSQRSIPFNSIVSEIVTNSRRFRKRRSSKAWQKESRDSDWSNEPETEANADKEERSCNTQQYPALKTWDFTLNGTKSRIIVKQMSKLRGSTAVRKSSKTVPQTADYS